MKKKNLNLEFYVFNLDFYNSIYRENILNDSALIERIARNYKKRKYNDFESLRDDIRSYFMYRYWSKVQYEYVVSGLMQNDTLEGYKLDVFYQIEKNLNTITELIIKHMELDIDVPKKYSKDEKFWEKCTNAKCYD